MRRPVNELNDVLFAARKRRTEVRFANAMSVHGNMGFVLTH